MNEEKRMQDKQAFGRFVAQKRKEAGLTQHELAARLYITDTAVSKWERGVTYPDITLISAICDALKITEHELITASEDVRQTEMEQQAERYQRMMRVYRVVLAALFGASLLICFICNLAVSHTLSWFFIVLAGETIAFSLTLVPTLVKRNRGLYTLGAFYLSLNFLLLVCRLYTGGNWFIITFLAVALGFAVVFLPFVLRRVRLPGELSSHKTLLCFLADTVLLFALVTAASLVAGNAGRLLTVAYPVALYCISLPWLCMAVLRYLRVNAFYRAAACSMGTAVYIFLINSVMRALIDGAPFELLRMDLGRWNDPYFMNSNLIYVVTAVFAGIGLLFLVGGVVWSLTRQRGQKPVQ